MADMSQGTQLLQATMLRKPDSRSFLCRVLAVAGVVTSFVAGRVSAGDLPLVIRSSPSGASVEIGGALHGSTPLTLTYPTGHFKAPATIWARHLSEPIEVTLRLIGYKPRVVKLGDGPNYWSSINGANHFTYYLLRPEYSIELEPALRTASADGQSPSNDIAYVEELRALARLREEGVLSDEEFERSKREILDQVADRRRAQDVEDQRAEPDPASPTESGEEGAPTFVLPIPQEVLTEKALGWRRVAAANTDGVDLFMPRTVSTPGFGDEQVRIRSVAFLKTEANDAIYLQVKVHLVTFQPVARTLRASVQTKVGDVAQSLTWKVAADGWGARLLDYSASRDALFAWKVSDALLQEWSNDGGPFLFLTLSQ